MRKFYKVLGSLLLMLPFHSSAQYCTPTFSSGCTFGDEISGVSVGTINNPSACSPAGYGDFLAQSTGMARTVSYQVNVLTGDYSAGIGVFIDWNQDQDFTDPGEFFGNNLITNANTVVAVNVTVPATAVLGPTRMRVLTNYFTAITSASSPCGGWTYGEGEDYTINVLPAPTCPQPTQLAVVTATTNSADFTWTVGGSETQWQIKYGPVGFNPATAGTAVLSTTNPSVNPTQVTGLPSNAFYHAYVRAVCGAGDTSFYTGPVSFNTYGLGQYIEAGTACGPGFTDISTTGTNLNLTDDSNAGLTLPFPFYYQGSIVNQMNISNNGYVVLGTLTGTFGYNMPATGSGLYPYIQDMGTATAPGGVYHETIGTAPNRKFIVQWNNVPHYGFPTPTDGATFQLIIEEATMEFYYVYEDVMMDNPAWDNGADAEIGIRGPQNINVSMNNATYLTNNECAHFYYTDCPKPQNIQFTNILNDEFNVSWTAGLSNETSWDLEYGPAGFAPGTGTTLTGVTATTQTIPGLTQLTQYDVYIYAQCASGDESNGAFGTVLTAPVCANPTALSGTARLDSLRLTWNWAQTLEPITSFNVTYGMTGFDLYGEGTEVVANGINFADTIVDTDLMAGVTYQVYVQAVCPNDTSSYVGPFSITMPVTNDTVCYAEMLTTDGTRFNFSVNNNASVNNTANPTEQSIAPPTTGAQTTTGWASSVFNRTTWFTFVAPTTGQVRVDGSDVGFDGQMAVYSVTDCDDFGTFELLAANDDEIGGPSFAPNFTVCGLTPGETYYLVYNPRYSWNTVYNYSIRISAITLEAGNFEPVTNICYGDTLDLFQTISGNDLGGTWIPTVGNIQLVQDSLFASAGLAYQTFDFQYRMVDGCAYDSIISQVTIFAPSSAGNDGGITACRNEPINLLGGLSGFADLSGTWYDPANNALASGEIITSNFPGQYNFDYIAGNGVCPDDTALVIVNVVGSCDFLSVEEMAFEGFQVYPNPTEGVVFISNFGSTEVFNYEVLDVNGRRLAIENGVINGTETTQVNLSSVENGIYLIRVYNADAQKTYRVVVR